MISNGVSSEASAAGLIGIVEAPVPYTTAWVCQSRFHRERLAEQRPDTLLILEHQPVYTLGRSTRSGHWGGREDVLRANGAEVHRVTRGGSVTYHGPGQVLLYPIVRLTDHARGPKQFVWLLEEVILRVLAHWGVRACRLDKCPGVWTDEREPAKVASVGIRVERGVTLHGIALNVEMDLLPFQVIDPCGIARCRVASMAQVTGRAVELSVVKQALAREFGRVFTVQWPVEITATLSPTSFDTTRSNAGA